MNQLPLSRALTRSPLRLLRYTSTHLRLPQHLPARTFTSLPPLRPTLPGSRSALCNGPAVALAARPQWPPAALAPDAADIAPKAGTISAHPALAAMQIRCAPRPNLNRPSRLIQKRRHGFLSRIRTRKGRAMLARRRDKGRMRMAVAC